METANASFAGSPATPLQVPHGVVISHSKFGQNYNNIEIFF